MMTTRRTFAAGSLGLGLFGASARRVGITSRFVVVDHGEVFVVLEDADPSVLVGLRDEVVFKAREPQSQLMTIEIERSNAHVRWEASGSEREVSLRNGCQSFLASWVRPLIGHGLVAYLPGEDLPVILDRGPGEFWRLPVSPSMSIPIALRSALSVYACFFGDFGSLREVDDAARQINRQLSDSADFVWNVMDDSRHPPVVLLTSFG